MFTNDLPDLVEAPLESTHSANPNVVFGCAASVLVLDSGILAKDVATADSVNLVAGFSVLAFVFVEPEGESALHPFGPTATERMEEEDVQQ